MPSVTEFLVSSMTPAMGELLYLLKTIMASQRDRLFAVLYTRYVSGLMEVLDRLLLEEVSFHLFILTVFFQKNVNIFPKQNPIFFFNFQFLILFCFFFKWFSQK